MKDATAQNRGQSASGTRARGPGRQFAKGQSGNPGGRPKGFAAHIRDQTGDGHELVQFAVELLRNEQASLKLRLESASWLADRAFGRPTQGLEHSAPDGAALIPIDILRAVLSDADGSED